MTAAETEPRRTTVLPPAAAPRPSGVSDDPRWKAYRASMVDAPDDEPVRAWKA